MVPQYGGTFVLKGLTVSNYQEVLVNGVTLVGRIKQCPVVQRMDNIRSAATEAGISGLRDGYRVIRDDSIMFLVPKRFSPTTIEGFRSNLRSIFTPVPPGKPYPGARY